MASFVIIMKCKPIRRRGVRYLKIFGLWTILSNLRTYSGVSRFFYKYFPPRFSRYDCHGLSLDRLPVGASIRIRKMFYRLIRWIAFKIFRQFFSLEVFGRNHVPASGAFILCSNHLSLLDPPLVGASLKHRQLWFMARDSLFKNFLFAGFIRALHAFPIKRGRVDRAAMKMFEDLIDSGKGVLLFPEGTRSMDGNLQEGKPGAGMLIYRCAHARVIPIRIFNSNKALPRGTWRLDFEKIQIVYGPPLDLSSEYTMPKKKITYVNITEKLMHAIAALQIPEHGADSKRF